MIGDFFIGYLVFRIIEWGILKIFYFFVNER